MSNPKTMDYTTQLRMGEIVRQLVAEDDEEFDPALAVELWEMLHGGRPRFLSFKMMGPSSSGVTGVTNTGASVHLKDDELKTYVDTSPSKTWAGKYAVHREDFLWKESAVYIEDRFDATRPAEDRGDAYRMEYKNGRPTGLLKAVRSIFTIPLPRSQAPPERRLSRKPASVFFIRGGRTAGGVFPPGPRRAPSASVRPLRMRKPAPSSQGTADRAHPPFLLPTTQGPLTMPTTLHLPNPIPALTAAVLLSLILHSCPSNDDSFRDCSSRGKPLYQDEDYKWTCRPKE